MAYFPLLMSTLVIAACIDTGDRPGVGSAQHTFMVNSTSDSIDAEPGDSACDDGTGACALRAAIMEANALPDTDAVNDSGPEPTSSQFQVLESIPSQTAVSTSRVG